MMLARVTGSLIVAMTSLACGSSDDASPSAEEPPVELDTQEPVDAAEPPESATLDCDDADVLCYEFGPVDVAPGEEWQGFDAVEVGNDEDWAIVGLEIEQTGAESHHYIVSLWSGDAAPPLDGPYDLFSDQGLGFVGDVLGSIVAGSIYQYVDIDTGEHVGVQVPAGAYLVNNGHFINTGTETVTGRASVRIEMVPAESVPFLAIEAQPGVPEIDVPPGEARTVAARWDPPVDVAILLMTSHMHRHGRLFEVWSGIDGEETKIYSTTEYDAPPLQIFAGVDEPPLVLRPASGDYLRFECTHENDDLDFNLTFGPTAASHEMCIMPVFYVPDPDPLLELMSSGEADAGFSWDYVPYGG